MLPSSFHVEANQSEIRTSLAEPHHHLLGLARLAPMEHRHAADGVHVIAEDLGF